MLTIGSRFIVKSEQATTPTGQNYTRTTVVVVRTSADCFVVVARWKPNQVFPDWPTALATAQLTEPADNPPPRTEPEPEHLSRFMVLQEYENADSDVRLFCSEKEANEWVANNQTLGGDVPDVVPVDVW